MSDESLNASNGGVDEQEVMNGDVTSNENGVGDWVSNIWCVMKIKYGNMCVEE